MDLQRLRKIEKRLVDFIHDLRDRGHVGPPSMDNHHYRGVLVGLVTGYVLGHWHGYEQGKEGVR